MAPPNAHQDAPVPVTGRDTAGNSLEQSRLDLLGPAYMLEWSADLNRRDQQHCRRTRLGDAEALRASLLGQQEVESAPRLFVIQGLPAEYLSVLKEELGVEPRFVDAHVGRRGYRPLIRRRDGVVETSTFACFEYPELLMPAAADRQIPSTDIPELGTDVVGEPSVHQMLMNGEAVMFCRASLWLGPRAHVLLLDRPLWTRPSSYFQKARYRSSDISHYTTRNANGVSSDTLRDEYTGDDKADEIPCFETLLYESLVEHPDGDVDIQSLAEDIALHQWTTFFEALSTDAPVGTLETTALYWQAQKSLEMNLSGSQFRNRSPHPFQPSPATADWEAFLSRLSRRAALLSQLKPVVTSIQLSPDQLQQQESHPRDEQTAKPIATNGAPPLIPRRRGGRSHHHSPGNNGGSSSDDENKHSLDRVSYMGGILLPLSIVSSILSMSDPFGPTGNMFFVFWAASIPLVVIAVLVIYADTIRKAEVWIEVASSGSGPSLTAVGGEKPGDEEAAIEAPELGFRTMPYNETVHIDPPLTGRARIAALRPVQREEGEEDYSEGESFEEPSMMVEKLFKDAKTKGWRKEQLGWSGACKAALRIYKLKQGRPPNWPGNVKHGRTA